MRTLIATASRHGSTAEIAAEIGRVLSSAGPVDVVSPDDVDGLDGYDVVVVGSAVYYGRWLPEAVRFIRRNEAALKGLPVWLFSSGPLGDASTAGAPSPVSDLAGAVGARGHQTFAGRLDRNRLGRLERLIATVVRAPFGDFRDWPGVRKWARAIAGERNVRPGAPLAEPGRAPKDVLECKEDL